jgi:acetaldehyde dehydrogenase/alcohol dehydrogenase
MICASEQAVIVDEAIQAEFEANMKSNNCYFLNSEETELVTKYVINLQKMAVNPDVVGKPAEEIARNAGITVPTKTKILIAKLPEPSREYLYPEIFRPFLHTLCARMKTRALSMPKKCLSLAVWAILP